MKRHRNCTFYDHVTDRDEHVLCIVKDILWERQDLRKQERIKVKRR